MLDVAGPPHILVETQRGEPRTLPLEETAPGHYEARIPGNQGGLYHIVSGNSELILPEAGFYRESEETKPQAVNTALLAEISRVTGGRMHPSIDQLLNDKGAMVRERQPLWPYWLILALILNFVEVALRKGFFERLASWLRRRSLPRWHRQPA
jgi:hypothetical protein